MTSATRPQKRFHPVATRYFRFFANFVLRRWHPRVIAITGSADKATLLHMIEFELGERAHCAPGTGSAISIALDLLGLDGTHGPKLRWLKAPIRALHYRRSGEFYVVEIDDSCQREADFLTAWLKPEITLSVSPDTSTVQFKDKTISFDQKQLKRYNVYPTRTDFIFETASFHFSQPQPRDIATQLLILEALADHLDVPLRTDFSNMPVPPGRSSYFRGKNGLNLIDSSYDARLASAGSILEMARDLRAGHKWLVIGDIVDQGQGEEHRKLADLIAESNPEMVILIGPSTKEYTAPRLRELGVPARTTLDPKKALTFIEQNATGEETLVFKGGEHLEWIIEKLLEDSKDAQYLPGRDPAAVKNRKKRGLE